MRPEEEGAARAPGRVGGAQHVVQPEVHKAQQRLIKFQEREHHPVVHVVGQHLRTTEVCVWEGEGGRLLRQSAPVGAQQWAEVQAAQMAAVCAVQPRASQQGVRSRPVSNAHLGQLVRHQPRDELSHDLRLRLPHLPHRLTTPLLAAAERATAV